MSKRGRRSDPQRQFRWQVTIRRWQASGQSIRAYCRAHALKESAFCFWRHKLAGLGHDPLSGHLFVFRSRRGDCVKLLWWDRDGWTLYYKRLERGTFRFPTADDPQMRSVEVSAEELSLLLWGIDPASVKRQKRYQRASA